MVKKERYKELPSQKVGHERIPPTYVDYKYVLGKKVPLDYFTKTAEEKAEEDRLKRQEQWAEKEKKQEDFDRKLYGTVGAFMSAGLGSWNPVSLAVNTALGPEKGLNLYEDVKSAKGFFDTIAYSPSRFGPAPETDPNAYAKGLTYHP